MKKLFLILTTFFLILSCHQKDDDDVKTPTYSYLTYIKAGQTNGIGIRYVDIVPDDESLGKYSEYPLKQTKELDLNKDNIADFELISDLLDPGILGADSWTIEIRPLGMNSVCVIDSNNYWVNPLRYGDTISVQDNWSDSTSLLFDYNWTMAYPEKDIEHISGYWYNNDNIYIGVKIVIINNQLFGWIDMKKNVLQQFAVTVPYLE
jgi:hypothetical protein